MSSALTVEHKQFAFQLRADTNRHPTAKGVAIELVEIDATAAEKHWRLTKRTVHQSRAGDRAVHRLAFFERVEYIPSWMQSRTSTSFVAHYVLQF